MLSIVAILLLAFMFILSSRIEALRRTEIENTVQSYYDRSKLEHCYNEKIVPCNDTEISEWNNANPDRQFEIKSFKQLMENAEKAYSDSN